jgi:C-terminal processing protease CtpA/Prc
MSSRALLIAALTACGGSTSTSHAPGTTPATGTQPADKARAADPIASVAITAAVRAHEALVSTSVVPADSARVSTAALAALAAALGRPAPEVTWSGDAERDRGLLAERGRALAAEATAAAPADLSLRVARAMALAAGDPHVFALASGGIAGLLAATTGLPYVGLGFAAHRAGKDWVVSEVYPGGAAERARLARGAVIRSIDGHAFDYAVAFVDTVGAREGRTVTLEVVAPGSRAPATLALALTQVQPPLVEPRILPGLVGLLRIHSFASSADATADTGAQVTAALTSFDRQRVSRLVIDLRDNLGGNPVPVASLLAAGDPLMWMQRPGEDPRPLARDRARWKRQRPIAVVVNEQTTSAAEMTALALRELAGARIVGQPTAGALTFPNQIELPDGVLLFYPDTLTLGARSLEAPGGRRVRPDDLVANRTAADYAAGRDAQLDAAVDWVVKQK